MGQHREGIRVLFWGGLVCLILPAVQSPGAVPPAGFLIRSRSHAEYRIGARVFRVESNEVTTSVLPAFEVELNPYGNIPSPAYELEGGRSDTLYCTFSVKNRANQRDSLALSHSLAGTVHLKPEAVVPFKDGNGDGRYTPGEEDPAYLALDAGDSTSFALCVVLPESTVVARAVIIIRATSTSDRSAFDQSALSVRFLDSILPTLFVGPEGNPLALPSRSGEDDRTVVAIDSLTNEIVFKNEIANLSDFADYVEVLPVDSTALPPGVTFSVLDSSAREVRRSPGTGKGWFLGRVEPDSVVHFCVRLSSQIATLFELLDEGFTLTIGARSLIDTMRYDTTDDVVSKEPTSADGLLVLEQGFKEQSASPGDVVTLVVSVSNRGVTPLRDVLVRESLQPSLQFLAGGLFAPNEGAIAWKVGTLEPGEKRTAAAKLLLDGRVAWGKTSAAARANGFANNDEPVRAGPVVSFLSIEQDRFIFKGTIFGDVFIDGDGDGRRDEDEEGLPGATVYLESGEYVVADSTGLFALTQVFSGYRIARLDLSSIPDSLAPAPRANDGLAWRIVHMLEGGSAVISFPLVRRATEHEREKPVPTHPRHPSSPEPPSRSGGAVYQLESIPSSHFESGQAYLKKDAIEGLEPIVRFLIAKPAWRVHLEGHTDSIPIHNSSFSSNYELSLARARAVGNLLSANGVEEERITVLGYGDTRPSASNGTARGRSLNRRVEVFLVPPGMEPGDAASRKVLPGAEFVINRSRQSEGYEEGSQRALSAVTSPSLADSPFVEPQDGTVFSRRDKITVRACVELGSIYELSSGGRVVEEGKIGRKIVDIKRRLEEITWYGVRIEEGWSEIVLGCVTPKGKEAYDTLRVALSGKAASLVCERDELRLPADGKSEGELRFLVSDRLGLPVADGTIARITEGDSLIATSDTRPEEPGLQVASREGTFSLRIASSREPRKGVVRLEIGELSAACRIVFESPRRSLIAGGIVDTRVGRSIGWGSAEPFGIEEYNEGWELRNSSRVFIQGTTRGGTNFTLRLDSKKRSEDALLKQLNPDRGYPIYGDRSQIHFTAPSRMGNYVALERSGSFVRYGDLALTLGRGELLRYRRTLTGVSGSLGRSGRTVGAFVAKTDFTTFEDEIPGDGTSGYYYLSKSPVLENSEKVTIEVRDRYQPEKILSVKPLVRHRDYTINYLDGSILFKEPVPAFERKLDPVTVVVVYEVDGRSTGIDSRHIYGVDAVVEGLGGSAVGVSALKREGEGKGYSLYGASGSFSLGSLKLRGEAARSEDEVRGSGNAFKFEGAIGDQSAGGSFYARRIDGFFLNPSFSGGAHELGSIKAGYRGRVKLGRDIWIESSGYDQRFHKTGERKNSIDGAVGVKRGHIEGAAGFRRASDRRGGEENSAFLGLMKLGVSSRRGAFSTALEKNVGGNVTENYPDRITSKATLEFLNRFRLLATHEYLTSARTGASNQANFGVESKLGGSSTVYTRYSMRGTVGDERLGAIVGIRENIKLSTNLSARFHAENYRSISGDREEDYLSFQAGVATLQKGSHLLEAQYEQRWQRRARKQLLRVNALRRLGEGVALILTESSSYFTSREGRDGLSFDGRLGAVWRAPASPVTQLFLLKSTYERFSPLSPESITWKAIFVTDLNIRARSDLELRFKYGAKYVEDYSHSIAVSSRSQLFLSQFIYNFAKCWDVDLWGRLIRHSNGSLSLGSGVELGRRFMKFVRIAGGYALGGLEERDVFEREVWSNGFNVRVQLVLSEEMLEKAGIWEERK